MMCTDEGLRCHCIVAIPVLGPSRSAVRHRRHWELQGTATFDSPTDLITRYCHLGTCKRGWQPGVNPLVQLQRGHASDPGDTTFGFAVGSLWTP